MDEFYEMANLFVWKPERAWAIGLAFFGLYILSCFLKCQLTGVRSWIILVPAVAWGLFGLGEFSCKLQGANIRVDLLFTWPAVIIISVLFPLGWLVSITIGLKNRKAVQPQPPPGN